MHEVSIALSLLDIAEENLKKAGGRKINSIRVRIGRASSVVPSALSFAFEAVKAGTSASEAGLIIDEVPLGFACSACKGAFETEEPYALRCPSCGSPSLTVKSGYELEVVELDVE